jgi:hypothetical protein
MLSMVHSLWLSMMMMMMMMMMIYRSYRLILHCNSSQGRPLPPASPTRVNASILYLPLLGPWFALFPTHIHINYLKVKLPRSRAGRGRQIR